MEDPSDNVEPRADHWPDQPASAGGHERPEGVGAPDASRPVRCVLLAEPTRGDAPPALLEALRRRRLQIATCSSTFEALAEIVGNVADGDETLPAAALVVIDPARTDQTRLRELLDALDVFSPRTVRWEFDESAPIKLHSLKAPARPTVHVRPGAADAAARSATAARLSAKPELRLTGLEDSVVAASATDEDEDDKSGADLLSEAEIDMLLADDGEEQPS